tara:strand:- start:215 stop:835 length:621 start_codon:yes stop_codon:yes gene_type:complete
LVDFREKIAKEKRKQFLSWDYWGKPVPGYGSISSELLLTGLAPAAHGGNRTGRVFTGDRSADFLMKCLNKVGISNQSFSNSLNDGLILKNTYMTAVLKCVPPQDKPKREELINCSKYLDRELRLLNNLKCIIALGKIAFDSTLKFFNKNKEYKMKDFPFGHGKKYILNNGIFLIGSYHPSPRNVNTGRLNEKMMVELFEEVKETMK